ncbi:hypothetical protein SLEP1_g24176 [Rubroshorea leprosula]|uniref:Reverse transcriptase domain-containing protein n=1 Tax=Rubroshorea leprosula TaxID=152421 RepID=A0AAV5JNZ1_9ROSI|nr:hypothetical protein SLEP1_g24176 [Rubroshorea leprosula]
MEEDLWFMKSRSNWIVDGDKNSKFFHLSTIKHRNHNRIHGLRISDEEWITDPQGVANLIRNHFMHLFSLSLDHSFHDSFVSLGVNPSGSLDLSCLEGIPNVQEIKSALFCLKAFKAPGPDGLHPAFFQKMWESRTDSFTPSRGICQGDPLSPYIFILCMEYLSIKLSTDMSSGKASRENCQYLNNVLHFFCERSGQKINKEKSRILFSRNVDSNTRDLLSSLLGFRHTNDLGKYLGIPISAKKASKDNCSFILDKIRAKLSGWKSKFFSMAGD